MTLQTSAWYAGDGDAALATVGAIAVHGVKTSIGEQACVFGANLKD